MPLPLDGIEYHERLSAGDLGEPFSADQARAALKAGNQRYVNVHKQPPSATKGSDFIAFADGITSSAQYVQRPFAAILCCADSRVAPEIVFDQTHGNLFVVRTAGNTSDAKTISNMAYALHALRIPLIVVMGHQECGAVGTAIDALDGIQTPERYAGFVDPIVPHVQPTNGRPQPEAWESGVRSNVRATAQTLRQSPHLLVSGTAPEIDLVYYRLSDGSAEFFT